MRKNKEHTRRGIIGVGYKVTFDSEVLGKKVHEFKSIRSMHMTLGRRYLGISLRCLQTKMSKGNYSCKEFGVTIEKIEL